MQVNLNVAGLTVAVEGRPMLIDLDHKFQAGTVTLVVGRSGTGKTMLLETLSGVREPAAGTIEVGSEPLWLKSSSRRRTLNRRALLLLGTAFQHPEHQLFARTVREELLYTLEPYKLPPGERVSRMGSLLPPSSEDMQSWQARDPYTLSGGEKRRLLLSLLQAAQPAWLLLDEPTAGMDHEGISLLCSRLKEWKQSGKGAIVVTHDFESLLPAADRVLILHEGHIAWDGTPAEMAVHPHVLEDAGLALSERLETLRMLRLSGIPVPDGWVDAREAAAAIARGLLTDPIGIVNREETSLEDDSSAAEPSEEIATAGRVPGFMKRDPLAVWLSYIGVSTGILLQTHWFGWLAGVIVTLGVIGYSHVPYRIWSKPASAFFVFTMIAVIISGITYDNSVGLGFSLDPALETFFRFGRLIMVMLIGFVLLSGLGHLRLKRALEQRLQGLQRLRFPVPQFALVASLMVRFLPTVVDEWHRFARISAARGKYPVRPGRLPMRRMYRTAMPFLISLLRLGEMWSIILMSRGVGREGWHPTQAFKMKLNRQDGYLIATASGALMMLLVIRLYWS